MLRLPLRARLLLLAAACAGALALAPAALAYSWPLKPFDEQHPIRGGFDDPRILFTAHTFHFGIDISAPDGTPVYAVAPGRIDLHVDGVSVLARGRSFGYWHVIAAVDRDQRVRLHELLGYVGPGWGHLHFAESRDGVYLNPLRIGGIDPYVDDTSPTVSAIQLTDSDGEPIDPAHVTGAVDVIATAYDTPPQPLPPAPWSLTRVTPALIRWRLTDAAREVRPWETAVDFRTTLLQPDRFNEIYAPGTTQNRANHPGRYRFYLARGWKTQELPNGHYRLEVEAEDTRANTGTAGLELTIDNPVQARR